MADISKSLKLSFTSEKNVTQDDIVNEANVMWKYVKLKIKADYNGWKEDGGAALMKEMQTRHREFCTSYPVVNRYMCMMGQYNTKAFKMWIMRIAKHPWKTEDEYIEAQADYIAKLYLANNPRASKTNVANVKANTYKLLMDEHKSFKSLAEETEKVVTKNEKLLSEKNADELYYFVKNNATDAISGNATRGEGIRVESDIIGQVFVLPTAGTTRTIEFTADELLL